MQIVITYEDGTGEVVPARLEGDVVLVGQRWVPGILTDDPERGVVKSDYFGCALNEGHEREGVIRSELATWTRTPASPCGWASNGSS